MMADIKEKYSLCLYIIRWLLTSKELVSVVAGASGLFPTNMTIMLKLQHVYRKAWDWE